MNDYCRKLPLNCRFCTRTINIYQVALESNVKPMSTKGTEVTASTVINAPIEKVWEIWTTPEHIRQWNNFSDDWETTYAENDVCPGGKLLFKMGLKDGSLRFDHAGIYDEVIPYRLLRYTTNDGRGAEITFSGSNPVTLIEVFETDASFSAEEQRQFCQAIHDRFKEYVEGLA